MDHAISAVIGAILFAAFVLGLAESIGSIAFFVIVFLVVGLLIADTRDVIKEYVILPRTEGQDKASTK